MDTILWVLQGGLAVVFLGSGLAKSTMSRERMIATGQTGYRAVPDAGGARHRCVGAAGGVGLAAALGDGHRPVAHAGGRSWFVCVVMVGAAWSHSKLREPQNVAANGLFFAAALAVAIGRLAML